MFRVTRRTNHPDRKHTMGLKDRFKAIHTKAEAERLRKKSDPRRTHYNETGDEDAFSTLIRNRLRELGMDLVRFAEATEPVSIRSAAVATPSTKRRTSPSLISRVLSGQRPLPVERIPSWADALELVTQKQRRTFLVLVLLANGVRSIRRTVADTRLRAKLEADLVPEMERITKDWIWPNP